MSAIRVQIDPQSHHDFMPYSIAKWKHYLSAEQFRCGSFIGLSSNSTSLYGIFEFLDLKPQQDTALGLRTGRKNLVIATDVLEEGIDVTAYNAAICFDPWQNVISFFQRRGRARKERSAFVITLPRGDTTSKVELWKKLEE